MQFSKTQKRRGLNKTALNLSSMIDVTFLLLIYFIVTTVFNPAEDNLSPALQVEGSGVSVDQDFEPQIISVTIIDSRPVYQIGGHFASSRAELIEVISTLPTDPGIIIRVDDDVPVGFAVAAVQEARNVGFEKVTYVPATQ